MTVLAQQLVDFAVQRDPRRRRRDPRPAPGRQARRPAARTDPRRAPALRVLSEAASTVRSMNSLNDGQLRMLAFERQWWNCDDAHLRAVRRSHGAVPLGLAELVTLSAALAYDPLLVRRLRRELVAGANAGR